MALAAADTYVVVLALTEMMQGVGVGIESLQRATPIVSGFLLGYVAVLPLIGRLADLLDTQRVLLGCLAVFVVGSGITALATELPVLVAGRVVQGAGGGGLVPATLALVAALWPPERRGMPLGLVGAVQELGSVVGPVLGAAILAVADWRMIFWLNAIAGVVLAAALVGVGRGDAHAGGGRHTGSGGGRADGAVWGAGLWLLGLWVLGLALLALALAAPERLTSGVRLGVPFVPFGELQSRITTPIGVAALGLLVVALGLTLTRHRAVLRRADAGGAVLIGMALGCVILTFASAQPETQVVGPWGYLLLPLGLVCTLGYGVLHRRSNDPVIPHGVLRGRTAWALGVSFCVGVALVAVVVNIPLLARLVHTSDEAEAAFVLLRFLLAVPVGALVGGWALRHAGEGPVAALGMACAATGLALMTSWGEGALGSPASWVILALTGFGIGLTLAPVTNAALRPVSPGAHGAASALVVVARMIGMVLGLALLTAIGLHRYFAIVAGLADPTNPAALKGAAIAQLHWVFWGAAGAAAVGAACATRLGASPSSRQRRSGLRRPVRSS